MELKPSTIKNIERVKPGGERIAVYKNTVRIHKEGAVFLNLPKNNLAFHVAPFKSFLQITADGFRVTADMDKGFRIANRKLCRALLENFGATKRVNLSINKVPMANGCFELIVTNIL